MGKKQIDYSSWSKDELIRELKRIKETTYGLVWHRDVPEEKIDVLINPDARTPEEMFANEIAGKPFPVLREAKDKHIKAKKEEQTHLLIEGDNYHALAVLNFTHQESVDVIYIDPPYNTGNKDFRYTDTFKSDFVEREDPFRHSKWLSFMEKRLKLAHKLLKESGILYISIDDNEFAPLKMLCDEIFGEDNFVANIVYKNKAGAGAKPKAFIEVHEYILVYTKNASLLSSMGAPYEGSNTKLFTKKDEHFLTRGPYGTWALATTSMADRPNLRYPIVHNGEEIWPEKQWLWSRSRVEEAMKNNELVFNKMKNGRWSVRFKRYLRDSDGNERKATPTTFFDGPYTHEGTRDLVKIFGDRVFDFPKPVSLVKKLLNFTYNGEDNRDIVVLDFMAGTGTTGQAVLELNKEDGGNRQFILCTNNENDICTAVCQPRIKNIVMGYTNKNGEAIDGLGGNLKYFTAYDFVESEPTDKNKRKLVKKSTEMLCIKEGVYDLVKETEEFKILKNPQGKYLGVIFYEDSIGDYKKEVRKLQEKVITYVFSLGDDPHRAEFEDVADMVNLQPIPEVILRVYREIFK